MEFIKIRDWYLHYLGSRYGLFGAEIQCNPTPDRCQIFIFSRKNATFRTQSFDGWDLNLLDTEFQLRLIHFWTPPGTSCEWDLRYSCQKVGPVTPKDMM